MALKTQEQELLDRIRSSFSINGELVWATNGTTFDVVDPATGGVIKTIADARVEDAVRALDIAVKALESWGNTPSRERSNTLRRAFDLLMGRKNELAC